MLKLPARRSAWTTAPRRRLPLGRRDILAVLGFMLAGVVMLAGALWATRPGSAAVREAPVDTATAPLALAARDALVPPPAAGPLGGDPPAALPSPLPTMISPALATVLADLPATLPPGSPSPAASSLDAGPAPPVPGLGDVLVVGPPSLSAAMLDTVLECYDSPAKGLGAQFYAAGVQYAVDPAYGLAWFVHESRAGTRGLAPTIKSIGVFHALPGAPAAEGFQTFASWEDSIADWFTRISSEYVHEQGLRTVAQIVARYDGPDDPQDAPSVSSDIETLVQAWRRGAAGTGPMPTGPNPIFGIPPAAPLPTPPPGERTTILAKPAEITSEFGHYPDGGVHYGLDLRASAGVPQTAPVGGIVEEVHRGCVAGNAACGRGWGNHVWWRSAVTGHHLLLAHFQMIDAAVQVGATLQAGQLVGLTGMTGYATGPHVHIQVNPDGLADTGAIQPALEFPWMACGANRPLLGALWGAESCP